MTPKLLSRQEKMERTLKGLWQLLRIAPVLSWSGAGVSAVGIPLILFDHASVFVCLIPFIGGLFIQGLLAHAANDIVDDLSGTDFKSPALLSGGSRVIQSGLLSSLALRRLTFGLFLFALVIEDFLISNGKMGLFIILAIGIWASVSYSLPPFRLSYRPFLGEWLSAFPGVIAVDLVPALLYFNDIPNWAIYNAADHALFSIGWLMVHHIPDVKADSSAHPQKRTTVVFSHLLFGIETAVKYPAYLYFALAVLFPLSFILKRPVAAGGSMAFAFLAFFIISTVKTTDIKKLATAEILLMVLSCANAVWIGFNS